MGFLVYDQAVLKCPHGGQVSLKSSNTRVCVDGNNSVMTECDKFEFLTPICPLPQNQNPCKGATWKTPSTRIKVSGTAVVLDDSDGVCHNEGGAFTGILNVKTQSRVKGAL